MTEILIRCNDIEMPKNGTLTLVVHPNGDAYLGDVLKDIKIGKAIELPPHGRLGDLDKVEDEIMDSSTRDWLDALGVVRRASTVLEAST